MASERDTESVNLSLQMTSPAEDGSTRLWTRRRLPRTAGGRGDAGGTHTSGHVVLGTNPILRIKQAQLQPAAAG